MKPKLPSALVSIARREVGVEEVDGTNCGPQVDCYKAATNLPPHEPWPWCAAFICWVVWKALKVTGIAEGAGFRRPTTAGAWDFINWSKRQDSTTHTLMSPKDSDIQPGDIVVFTFSHIGLAIAPGAGGWVQTIEGNTNGEGSREGGAVLEKRRPIHKIKARIRFTV